MNEFEFEFWCLTQLSAIFQLYHGDRFSGGGSQSTRKEPPTLGKQLVNIIHLRLRVECTLFYNLQSWARTHAELVIGLYELLGNQTLDTHSLLEG